MTPLFPFFWSFVTEFFELNDLPLNFELHLMSVYCSLSASCFSHFSLCLPPSQVPPRISLPASHLLNSIASTVRPSFMTALEKIQNLFHDVNSGALSELPLEVGFTTNYFTEKRYIWPFSLRCLSCIIAELSGVLFQWFHGWSRRMTTSYFFLGFSTMFFGLWSSFSMI